MEQTNTRARAVAVIRRRAERHAVYVERGSLMPCPNHDLPIEIKPVRAQARSAYQG
jgi:hypothetical protein